MPLVHHELCFGCGRNNLFGLLLDARRDDDGAVTGRWFVKQDHQGPIPGQAHAGLLACALLEALTFLSGPDRAPASVECRLEPAAAPVGSFCEIQADMAAANRGRATASVDGRLVGALTCTFASANPGKGSVRDG
jgi:hypothetical protein